jgi:hypothetical protein
LIIARDKRIFYIQREQCIKTVQLGANDMQIFGHFWYKTLSALRQPQNKKVLTLIVCFEATSKQESAYIDCLL